MKQVVVEQLRGRLDVVETLFCKTRRTMPKILLKDTALSTCPTSMGFFNVLLGGKNYFETLLCISQTYLVLCDTAVELLKELWDEFTYTRGLKTKVFDLAIDIFDNTFESLHSIFFQMVAIEPAVD